MRSEQTEIFSNLDTIPAKMSNSYINFDLHNDTEENIPVIASVYSTSPIIKSGVQFLSLWPRKKCFNSSSKIICGEVVFFPVYWYHCAHMRCVCFHFFISHFSLSDTFCCFFQFLWHFLCFLFSEIIRTNTVNSARHTARHNWQAGE